jgi:hypothetical protein
MAEIRKKGTPEFRGVRINSLLGKVKYQSTSGVNPIRRAWKGEVFNDVYPDVASMIKF